MRKVLVLIVLGMMVLQTASFDIKGEEYQSISSQVKMKERWLKITIYYLKKDKDFAKHVLDLTIKSLPKIEELAGFSFPFGYDISIYIKEEWENQNRYEDGIILKPGTWDYAIIHENAHYWTAIYGWQRWLQEAFASLYPILIFKEWERFNDVERVDKTHYNWFHEYYDTYNIPLDEWKRDDPKERHDFLYGKMYCFIMILYEEFGIEILQEVNREIHNGNKIGDSRIFKKILEQKVGKNLDDLFSGWIFETEYKKYNKNDIKDNDKDGLYDFVEKIKGINPKNPDTDGDKLLDGNELKIGTDPLKKDTDNDGVLDGKEVAEKMNPLKVDTDDDGLKDNEDPHPLEKESLWKKRTSKEANSQFSEGIGYFENKKYSEASGLFALAKQKFNELGETEKVLECENYLKQIDEQKEKKSELLNRYKELTDKLNNLDTLTYIGLAVLGKDYMKLGEELLSSKPKIESFQFDEAMKILDSISSSLERARMIGMIAIGFSAFIILFVIAFFIWQVKKTRKKVIK